MGLLDRWRRARSRRGLAAAPNIPTAALPPGGRSSREIPHSLTAGLATYLSFWDGVEPLLPPAYLEQIIRIAIVNPDMSQAVSNWVALGNPGHDLILAGDDQAIERAHRRLNHKARSLARHMAGIDGLVNKYLEQVALTGAISSEDVVTLGADPGVDQVVVVPVSQIRFKREGGEYVPYQMVDREEIALNPITYRYLAYMTIENSPYAKPPMIAALEPILDQRAMKKNLQFIIKKFGLFGLISASVTPPKRDVGETTDEYRKRVQGYLASVLKAFKENFHDGMAVYTDDIKVQRTNLTTDVRGIQDIFRLNEEQVFSGLGSDPSMHGRTYSTTETYARVVYNLLLRHAESFQRPVKRRIERTYQLDLALAGIPIEDLSLHFHKAPAQDPLTEAKAKQVAWRVVREKVETGLLTPDAAARELGYDNWDDARLLPGQANMASTGRVRFGKSVSSYPEEGLQRLTFDSFAQRYRHVRPRAALGAGPGGKGAAGPPASNGKAIPAAEAMVEDGL